MKQPGGNETGGSINPAGIETRISAACDALGTRKSAASVTGVSVDSLRRYINGDISPDVGFLARLAEASGFSLGWLVTGEDRWAGVRRPGAEGAIGDNQAEVAEDRYGYHAGAKPASSAREPTDAELKGLGEKLCEIRTTIDQAVAEVGYDPGKWVREGLTTALFKGDLKPEGVVTLLQFLEAQHLDNR